MLAALLRLQARWEQWAGALPAAKVVWSLAIAFSLWVPLDIFVFQFTSGVSHATFDAMVRVRLLVAKPDPRVLIVDIDESSLKRMSNDFGRWPWPRDTLASVLDYLERQQPAAIVWDILFADADRINPGGDAAMDAAARRSAHSHFPVVRLEPATDGSSKISGVTLPGLWAHHAAGGRAQESTVALIVPVLPSVATGRLGFNNGYVDADGVLRRYRSFETLADNSSIRSIAMSVASQVAPQAYQRALQHLPAPGDNGELIAWRRQHSAYPHIPFADVFAAADGLQPLQSLPDFAGKIILIGSTAASLHDIHPTPLMANQPGVDTLATVLDNAVNDRHLVELPRWLHALLAVLLCLGLAYWVQERKIATLTPLTLALPFGLLLLSYATLNGSPMFIDLQLSAALALLFLGLLRYWSQLRRKYWCALPLTSVDDLALWPLRRDGPWLEASLDHLIDLLEQHSGECRIVVADLHQPVFQSLRWPELARHAAIIGPMVELQRMQTDFTREARRLCQPNATMFTVSGQRQAIADAALRAWSKQEDFETGGTLP